jgi:hypothetical protein
MTSETTPPIEKLCFVIAPIGEPDSEIRKRSDVVLKHIIHPAVSIKSYKAIRADQISEPGIITTQIIQHIIEDPLVMADLTGKNPNVFYELAIRHALRKPYIQLIQKGERIPFDIAAIRTIEVDHKDLESVDSAKSEIIKQIDTMERNECDIDSPISVAVDLEMLRQSGNPEQRQLVDVLAAVGELRSGMAMMEKKLSDPALLVPQSYLRESITSDIRGMMTELVERTRRARIPSSLVEELFVFFDRLSSILQPVEGKELSKEKLQEARDFLRRSDRFMQMIAMESGMPPAMMEDFIERRLRRKKGD